MGWRFWKHEKGPDLAMVFLGTVGLVIAALQTGIIYQQHLDGIEAGKQTADIAKAQRDIAKFTQDSVNAMDASVEQAKASLKETADYNRRSLNQSRKALDTSVAMSRNAQRARIGGIEPSLEMNLDSPLKATITIKNHGQTPALMVRNWIHLDRRPSGIAFKPRPYEGGKSLSCSVIQPGERMAAPAIENTKLTQELIDRIMDSTISVYLSGEITYDDIFGEHHTTTVAYALMPSLLTWRVLDAYNTAD